ncbi:MAG: GDP-L-fucose synthase [Polyangiaceae bacterium]
MNPTARIYVAGHTGLVGSAIVRCLRAEGATNLLLRSRAELDLTDQHETRKMFEAERPEYVFVAAAKVGGILENTQKPASFLGENLMIATNIVDAAHRSGVKKLLFVSSSCSYPKHAPQPLKEEYLLSGPLEPTNEWHSVAKIAGVKMCQAYRRQHGLDAIVAMSTSVYGPGDNFDPTSSHLLPGLMRRFHEAKRDALPSLTLWGTGAPRREFIHSDDLARACVFLMQKYSDVGMVNVGWGEDHPILDLANIVKEVVDYDVPIVLDTSKPDGTPRKLLDVSTMNALGFRPRIGLRDGLASMYAWYLANEV